MITRFSNRITIAKNTKHLELAKKIEEYFIESFDKIDQLKSNFTFAEIFDALFIHSFNIQKNCIWYECEKEDIIKALKIMQAAKDKCRFKIEIEHIIIVEQRQN